jgi:hypothetical protein
MNWLKELIFRSEISGLREGLTEHFDGNGMLNPLLSRYEGKKVH